VAVEVQGVQDLYGVDLALTFDPQVVEVVDADPLRPGVQAVQGPFLEPGFTAVETADNAAGSLRFVMTQLNPSSPKSGSGTLLWVSLRGRAASPGSPLELAAQLATRDGVEIETVAVSGRVQVAGSPASTLSLYGPYRIFLPALRR
jgi:hypothetical protein